MGLSFHPKEEVFATGGKDLLGKEADVTLWDAKTGKPKQKIDFRGRLGWVEAVAFFPNGRHLAVVGGRGRVYLWDLVKNTEASVLAGASGTNDQIQISP